MGKTTTLILSGILIGTVAGNLLVGKPTKIKVLIILIALMLCVISGLAIGFIYS